MKGTARSTTDDYVELTYGDSCPITGKEVKPTKCTDESNFDHNSRTGRCAFFSHIVVAAVCCKHPDVVLVRCFTDYLSITMPAGGRKDWYDDEKRAACVHAHRLAHKAWQRYSVTGMAQIRRTIFWYQNELDKPNKEWRPSIIMRRVLEAARLMEETVGIP